MSNLRLKWEDLWACQVDGKPFLELVFYYGFDDWIKKYYDKHKAEGGANLLLWAVATRQDAAEINSLLDAGAPINAVETMVISQGNVAYACFGSRTPLYIACAMGDLPRVKLLLARDNVAVNQRCTSYENTALAAACQNAHLNVVKVLLEDQRTEVKTIDNRQTSALVPACFSGELCVVEALLADGRVDVNSATEGKKRVLGNVCGGMTLKHLKIAERLLQVPDIIIDDINKHGETALLKLLNVDKWFLEKHKPIIFELVKSLVAHPSDVGINKVNRDGETALHLAVKLNCLELVLQLLLHPDCKHDVVDNEGATPLSLATELEYMDLIPFLDGSLPVNSVAP